MFSESIRRILSQVCPRCEVFDIDLSLNAVQSIVEQFPHVTDFEGFDV